MISSFLHVEPKPKTANPSVPFFTPTIQKKLSVGVANDAYEVEADTVANKVMRMTEPQQQNVSHSGSLVQRKCAGCEQEEKLQMKPLADSITPLIQRRSTESVGESHAPSHVESQINSSKGGGNSMDHGTQHFMERRFGTDFSDVKIHTGSQAVQMSRELNAEAFTVGNDVYFNEGKYSPNSDSGRHLLAHELTHTVQQKENPSAQRMIYRRLLRDARINFLCGSSNPFLRTPPSGFFTLTGSETLIRITSSITWDRPGCTGGEFFLILKSDGTFWDSTEGEATVPVKSGVVVPDFTGLTTGKNYYIEIRSNNTNPNCCLTGTLHIEAF
jgi:hypothetical protein